ncbi:MAG: 1-(5-phosphoribosyl)-5-[(5-phosphoribosylamino)methylideneamino]imidazole-4-carboxamide isomerase [Woeseiaceae bacterium]|nr:1-(5-phosphoribosyl)-5-[(5-phosphoribosylamino)methylideneamino]imidazole-4-carboxamide isomerase [Woeseiaceae bacterium]
MRVIPAIDLKDGHCVRLFQGDFDQVTTYSNDPLEIARRFSGLNVRDLHVVDLDGARTGTQQNTDLVRGIEEATPFSIQLGGGIRDAKTLRHWLFNGVDRCVIGSIAVTDQDRVLNWLHDFGPDRIVVALDVVADSEGEYRATTHGWKEQSDKSIWDLLDVYAEKELKYLLTTDVSRDGAMTGPNFDLYAQIVERYPDIQLQASGGVRDVEDLRRLNDLGVPAAITGRALLDGAISDEEVASFRQNA